MTVAAAAALLPLCVGLEMPRAPAHETRFRGLGFKGLGLRLRF